VSFVLGGLVPDIHFSRIVVGQSVGLDGSLDLRFTSDFRPQAANSFPLLSYGSYSEDFRAITPAVVPGTALSMWPTYQATRFSVTAYVCPYNCNGLGTCNAATATCTCTVGNAMGPACADSCSSKCNGLGTCVNGVCACTAPYSGSTCLSTSSMAGTVVTWTCSTSADWYACLCFAMWYH
jgi:hypothetical protein